MTGPGRFSTACARSIPMRSRRRLRATAPGRVGPAARRHPDPRQGQYRDRRPDAHNGRIAGAGRGARSPRRDARRAAARRRRGDPRQGQPDRVREHHRDRHAFRVQLARRSGAQPLCPRRLDERGVPLVSPGGSSSGSAVAVAAGLCAAAIGTETSGSLLSPATQNGLVTVKPTVGLISRAGILPIAHSQDTAGPLTRTVRDAAILLNVLAAPDPRDPATLASSGRPITPHFSTRTGCAAPGSACRATPPIPATMSISASSASPPAR